MRTANAARVGPQGAPHPHPAAYGQTCGKPARPAWTSNLTPIPGGIAPDTRLFPLKRPDSFLWEFRQKLGWHFRFHDLRHTFAKRLHDAGASEIMIAAALGHSWRTTTDRYTVTHINQDDLRPAFQRMEALAIEHANLKLSGVEVEATWGKPEK